MRRVQSHVFVVPSLRVFNHKDHVDHRFLFCFINQPRPPTTTNYSSTPFHSNLLWIISLLTKDSRTVSKRIRHFRCDVIPELEEISAVSLFSEISHQRETCWPAAVSDPRLRPRYEQQHCRRCSCWCSCWWLRSSFFFEIESKIGSTTPVQLHL